MTVKPFSVYIGFDQREASAFAAARESLRRFHRHMKINGVVLSDLQAAGLYTRPTERRLGKLWDVDTNRKMSTEFTVSRFLVPELVRRYKGRPYGWALFMDCDVLVRRNINGLIKSLDDSKALMCVKHDYKPALDIKMDGQIQTSYPRKNWASVMAFNVDHPSNALLDVDLVNSAPILWLLQLLWLRDDEIGELSPEYNYLVGETQAEVDPVIVHFTNGGPWFEAFRNVPYADEWFAELGKWAA